jgi:type VI secretion system protein ImpL
VLGGPIVATEAASGAFILAPGTDTLQLAIGTLVAEPFMRARVRGSITSSRSRGTRVLWNSDQLSHAARLEDQYTSFMDNGLSRFPEGLQSVVLNVARIGLEATMIQMIDPAQRAETSDGEIDEIRREIASLQAATPTFNQILGVFDRLHLRGYDELRSVLIMQGDAMLDDLTRLRERSELYAIGEDRFRSLEESIAQRPEVVRPGVVLLDAPDDVALAERVTAWRERIRELAVSAADPILAFLMKIDAPRSDYQAEWGKIVAELHRYDDKVAKNSVLGLEDLLMSLNDITEENYREKLVRRGAGDYFLKERDRLRTRLYTIFSESITRRVRRRYEALRLEFNRDLMSGLPFADFNDTNIRRSIPPDDLRIYFQGLDRFVTRDRDVWEQWKDPEFDEGYHAAYRFIDSMISVQEFMAPLLRTDLDHIPAYTFDVEFRANVEKEIDAQNIADWRMKVGDQTLTVQEAIRQGTLPRAAWKIGDRIQISLRWAKNSTVIPHTVTLGNGIIHKSDSHTVLYLFNDPHWALLHLLSVHRAPRRKVAKSIQPQVLEFDVLAVRNVPEAENVPTNETPPLNISEAYIRIGILSESRKETLQMPVFPTTAAPELPPLRTVP